MRWLCLARMAAVAAEIADFSMLWHVAAPCVSLPLSSWVTLPITVTWGDGCVESVNTLVPTHTYPVLSTDYQLNITGTFGLSGPCTTPGEDYVRSVSSWGGFTIDQYSTTFFGNPSLSSITATDQPAFLVGASVAGLFANSWVLNSPISWDLTNVVSTANMFALCAAFNSAVTFVNSGQVRDTSGMFASATVFNAALTMDTSGVTTMNSMFSGASAFDQPLNSWDVASVTDMGEMFAAATAFNQPLDQWSTASLQNASQMFASASAFNHALTWGVGGVTNMQQMFFRAQSFDQPLRWDVSRVQNMEAMFYQADLFTQDLSAWNVSAVTNCFDFCSGCGFPDFLTCNPCAVNQTLKNGICVAATPTSRPTNAPHNPSRAPSSAPSSKPTKVPSARPSKRPTHGPTARPSKRPSSAPTHRPTKGPTTRPSKRPTRRPTTRPSKRPTRSPSKPASG